VAVGELQNAASTQARLDIDPDRESRPYSPMIFGGFIEHFHRQIYGGLFDPGSPLSDSNGFRRDVIHALQELKLSVVRWPGGCFASGYHWRDGVGPNRRPTDDMAWGVREPNTFGTDEFVQWCRLVGCEPYICTNAGNGTIEEMRDWVAYCNQARGPLADLRGQGGNPLPFPVRTWSIGNENWGGHEIGTKTPSEWAPLVLEAARQMRAVDPGLILTAAATPSREWTLPLLQMAGRHLDYISIHPYWLGLWLENDMPDYLSCIMLSDKPETDIAETIRILDESGHRGRIKIAFDEWNLRGWHHPWFPRKTVPDYDDPEAKALIQAREKNDIASQYTMADALFSASFLNTCLRYAEDVGMANIAPIVNTRGPLFVHPDGLVKRTTFHTLAMYANLLGRRVGTSELQAGLLVDGDRSIPVADALATVDDAGRLWSIALINRHPSEPLDWMVAFNGTPLSGTFQATVLAGDSPDAYNDVDSPDRVAPLQQALEFQEGSTKLPPHSLTVLQVPMS
jgi:alpha-N-arabinofuranosidase